MFCKNFSSGPVFPAPVLKSSTNNEIHGAKTFMISYIFEFSYSYDSKVSMILQYQKGFSSSMQYLLITCVQGAYGESAFEELDEIFCIVQPNKIF